MGWGVTVSDVEQTTGKAVSSTDLAMAESSVEIYINRTPAASAAMKRNDIHWIQTAVRWQAAWLADQPDYTARQNVQAQSQDGVSVDYTSYPGGSESSLTLAPLARRALKNLTWKAGRTLSIPADRVLPQSIDPREEISDATTHWIYP